MTEEEELYSYIQKFRPMAGKAADRLNCEADDLLHDVYIKAIEYFGKFPDRAELENPQGFVYLLLKRTIINAKKREGTQEKYRNLYGTTMLPCEEVESIEDEIVSLELSPAMQVALDTINPNFSDTLWLHYVAELTAQDIADLQRVPLGTVLTRLHRGRKMLKKAYKEENQKGVN